MNSWQMKLGSLSEKLKVAWRVFSISGSCGGDESILVRKDGMADALAIGGVAARATVCSGASLGSGAAFCSDTAGGSGGGNGIPVLGRGGASALYSGGSCVEGVGSEAGAASAGADF